MEPLVLIVPVTLLLGIMIGCGIGSSWGKGRGRQKAEREYYWNKYESSLKNMLESANVDRDKVRELRDSGARDAILQATRFVKRSEPVPLGVAVQFVQQL